MLSTTLRRGIARARGQFGVRIFDRFGYSDILAEVLQATGRLEKRRCPLRAAVVVTLVVAMGLYRQLSIPAVFRELLHWFRRDSDDLGLRPVTDEALLHAKRRLGTEPLAMAFQALADRIPQTETFRGMRLHAFDGVRFSVPDSQENEKQFGRWKSSNGDTTAFPQVLAVARIALESHVMTKVSFRRCDVSDLDAAPELMEGLGERDLVLLDRGFHAVWLFRMFRRKSIHLLCRASASYKPRIYHRLGHGDYLVVLTARIPLPPDQAIPGVRTHDRVFIALRMIEFRIGRRQKIRLLTDLDDPNAYPAVELARLYHERWECELAYDELKTHLASPGAGTVDVSFRSRHPEGVLQEAYGLFIAFNLVRAVMCEATASGEARAREISFSAAIHVIRMLLPDIEASVGAALEQNLTALFVEIGALRLKRTRRPRRYPRVVRVKIIRFPRKRYWHRQHRVDLAARLTLVNHRSQSRRTA